MIKRKIFTKLLSELKSDKTIIITGMRRVGKTTLLRYLYDKVAEDQKVYLDLENPLNQTLFNEIDYDKIRLSLKAKAIGKGKRLIVFLDEIQNVKNIPSVVKYLFDHYQIKFFLTGSASFYLKNLFTESLAGRKIIYELYPLDFEEFLGYKTETLKKPGRKGEITEYLYNTYNTYFTEYIMYGGFPGVVTKQTHEEKMTELEDIFTSFFQNEVRVLSDFRKLDTIKSTIQLLIQRTGSKLDVSKISAELGATRITIQEYIDFLEGTYFIKRIRPYSKKIDVTLRGQPKSYIVDVGFLTRIGNISPSAILENAVFNLVKNYGEVFFYQTKAGVEIDFILKSGNQISAFEVKTHSHQSDINRLKKLSEKLGIKNYYLISQNYTTAKNVIYPFQL